jgi:hypothetical protein
MRESQANIEQASKKQNQSNAGCLPRRDHISGIDITELPPHLVQWFNPRTVLEHCWEGIAT